MSPLRVVLDWDGTVTEVDSLHMVLERFGDPEVYRRTEGALGRALTLHEVIAAELRTVTTPLSEVVDWLLGAVRVRAGFAAFAERHRPTIVSAGLVELIEPVLAREGVRGLTVHANRLDPSPDGWRVHFRDEAACATCGEACKRATVAGAPYAYVGDGYSDRCAALAADVVFARAGLAAWLEERGVPYLPFTDFRALGAALAEG